MNAKLLIALLFCAITLGTLAAPEENSQAGGGGGALVVNTVPENAAVMIDRALKVRSGEETVLAPGDHLIKVVAEGYAPVYRTVKTDGAVRIDTSVHLERLCGVLIVTSEPTGAEITAGDVSCGRTPKLITSLPLGVHRLTCALAGFLPKTFEVDLKDRTPVKVAASLVSSAAALNITCTITNTAIFLNGAPLGTAPCFVERAPTGDVVLRAVKKGYKTQEQTLRLTEGERRDVVITLELEPAKLKVTSIPDGARVYVDNSFCGVAPLELSALSPGDHRVRVEADGYDALVRSVRLAGGESSSELFSLVANTGRLLLTTEPDGVIVIVDGKEHGTTRLAPGGAKVSSEYKLESLKEGDRVLKFTRHGYFDDERKITIRRGATESIHVKLKKRFIPDYEVVTDTATYSGVLKSRTAAGIKLETSPGLTMTIPMGDVRSERKKTMPSK